MRGGNGAVETVSAAASAISSAESSFLPAAVAKRRWGRWWRFNGCFGSHRNGKRIGHAVFGAERQPAAVFMPFVAPPSSPVSFFQSEPPSVTQSPACVLSLATTFSPTGPYAHETNLVTPPTFSCNTEPSTAPFTPPPESVITAVASPPPKVPFAELLICSLERVRTNSGRYLEFNESKSHLVPPGGAFSTNPAICPPCHLKPTFNEDGDGKTANRILSLEFGQEIEMESVEESKKDPRCNRRNSITFGSVIDFHFDSVSEDEECPDSWSNE